MNKKFNLSSSEDFDDFFESALCGFVITDGKGLILRINKCTADLLKTEPEHLIGKRISEIFAIGGKIYLETHLWPLLIMQGYFDEIAIDLINSAKEKIPVYLNGYVRKSKDNHPMFMRFTLFKASDRRIYEDNLQMARKLAEQNLNIEKQNALVREQFIAVLGHDLRNPLGGIMGAAQLLSRHVSGEKEKKLINIIETSSKRMYEMISNIMDLTRGRLGGGISIDLDNVNLENLVKQVSDELKITFPDRIIDLNLNVHKTVICDPARVSQLVSNLLANAITHGSPDKPVIVHTCINDIYWEISVTNQGMAIPKEILDNLFLPFHRNNSHSNNSGLGLGLYIASEIAKAHNGTLSVMSNEKQTCFTFRVEL